MCCNDEAKGTEGKVGDSLQSEEGSLGRVYDGLVRKLLGVPTEGPPIRTPCARCGLEPAMMESPMCEGCRYEALEAVKPQWSQEDRVAAASGAEMRDRMLRRSRRYRWGEEASDLQERTRERTADQD